MKKTDALTWIGLIGGIALVIMGMVSDYGFGIFWDIKSLFITVGGSLAAVLIAVPLDEAKKMFTVLLQAFKENKSSSIEVINQFSSLSKRARREGLLSLEDATTATAVIIQPISFIVEPSGYLVFPHLESD